MSSPPFIETIKLYLLRHPMKMFAIFGFVAGALFMLHGVTTDTQSAIHQIYTALWSIGGAQVIMLSAIL